MQKRVTTKHITANEFVDWFSRSKAGGMIVYAAGQQFAKEAAYDPELMLLQLKVWQIAMDGVVALVQKVSGPPLREPFCRSFEYIAIKRKERDQSPGWTNPGWLDGRFVLGGYKQKYSHPRPKLRLVANVPAEA